MFRPLILATTASVALLVAAPAFAQSHTPSPQPAAVPSDAPNPDPWEGTNRGLFKLNKGLDRAVVRPSAVFYHHALATPVREGVHNVIYNLGEPVTFVNNLLQARPRKAAKTVVRFAVNTTIGIGGIFDVTGANGMQREPSGFSATLGRYGTPQGPYIFLPVFGPSSVRDLSGRVVDVFTDPFTWINYTGREAVQTARSVAGGLDQRVAADEALKDVDRTATDPYATLRSAFLQNSEAAAHDIEQNVKALPDFGPEPSAPSQNPPPKPSATSH